MSVRGLRLPRQSTSRICTRSSSSTSGRYQGRRISDEGLLRDVALDGDEGLLGDVALDGDEGLRGLVELQNRAQNKIASILSSCYD